MPRPKNHAAHIQAAVSQLLDAVTAAVRDAEARVARNGAAPTKSGRASGARGGMRGAWTPERRAKLKKAQAAYWANLTPAQHKERIRKLLAGRGLKPKGAAKRGRRAKASVAKRTVKAAPARRAKAGGWAALSPEQRAARVARMQAGRATQVQG